MRSLVPLLALAACTAHRVEPREPVPFADGDMADISEASGIQQGNFAVDPPEGTVINDHSRLAFADVNGDRIDDIVMHSLYPNAQNGVPFEHLVFLGNGDGTFTDHSDASGLRDVQAAFFAFGDLDNDGDQDLFAGVDIPDLGSNAIYLNDGAGVFTVLPDAGVVEGTSKAANALFFDANGDGNLDLFVGNGGTAYLARDQFFFGNGDGTFTYDSDALPQAPRQPANGSVACDFDDDGDVDIFVSNYSVSSELGANQLWVNDGSGRFSERGVALGFASQATGNSWLPGTGHGTEPEPDRGPGEYIGSNGFGIDCADANGDGLLDIALATISHPVGSDYNRKWSDPSQLLLNQGPSADYAFVDAWAERGLPFNEGDLDVALVDIDLDGQLDISLSRESKYEANYDEDDQKGWFGLMLQDPSGFSSRGLLSGINDSSGETKRMKGAQNHAWADIDLDGDLDLLVGGRDQGGGRPNFLFENTVGQDNRHLVFYVEGDGSAVNRDGIGTRLRFTDDATLRVAEVKSSRGMYNSEDTQAVHMSLHDLSRGAVLTVQWPDGSAFEAKLGRDFGDGDRVLLRYPDTVEVLAE